MSRTLKDYRKTHCITQEQLAETLGIDPRTLRLWESGRAPESIRELRRVSDLLGIEPECLGIAASLSVPRTAEQVEEIVNRVWLLMDEVRVNESTTIIEHLVQNLRSQIVKEDPLLLRSFAHALHAAGYVASMRTRTGEVALAIAHYHELETIAHVLNDATLLNIALAYQGDMYRRQGEIQKAMTYLETARDTTEGANTAARGNGLQFLARSSFLNKDIYNFERAMAEAEELAATIDPATNSIHGHYNAGTIYEEYGKSYAAMGHTRKALDYVQCAEAHLPPTTNNRVLLMIVRAEALIYGGELDSGEPLAIEAARLSRLQGHQRRLERIQNIKRYLYRQSLRFGKAEMELDEALNGPIEQWKGLPFS